MRASTNKKDWISDGKGAVIGLSLGFDFCYEHESGVEKLHRVLGVPALEFPIGTGDRKISVCPDYLEFVEYEIAPKDKRRKKATPAASLILTRRGSYREITHEELLKALNLSFYCNVYDKCHDPELDDLMCSWGEGEFGINVRGAENISRLRELHEAFKRCDIALAHPSSNGFLRTGLSFAIASRIPVDSEEAVKAQDLEHQRLHEAARATGVYEMLEKAGLGYYALAPGWDNVETKEGVVFFINPQQQQKYHHGWFSREDFQQAIEGKGPVLKDAALIAFDEANRDWSHRLLGGLTDAGLFLRRHSYLVWMDAEKTKVGIYLRPAPRSAAALPEGAYPFNELMAKYGQKEEAVEAST
jgi:hypothetical protein